MTAFRRDGDEIRIQMALVRLNTGNLAAAEAMCRTILRDNPRNLNAHSILGRIAFDRRNYDEADACYRKCLKISPKSAQTQLNMGRVRFAQGRLRSAMANYEKALKLKPGYPEALAAKAEVLQAQGRYERVQALLDPEVKAGRDIPEIACIVAAGELRRGNPERAIDIAGRHFNKEDLPPLDRYRLGSTIGKAYERLGEYEQAFRAYQRANEAVAEPLDIERVIRETDTLIDTFSRKAMGNLPRASKTSNLPVLSVGMPRTGSTLVEQIIDAHPKAHGAGELLVVGDAVDELRKSIDSDKPYPAVIEDATRDAIDDLGGTLIDRFRAENGSADRIVDKNLLNYVHLGVLSMLTPGARVVHCVRNPMDTCFSCYAEMLDVGSHPYSTDLESLGVVYNQYQRLMNHWQEVIDLPVLEVQYEDLVAEPEAQAQRIIEFCDLEWDDRCLKPHESKRPVMTLSHDQVRKPIYRSSVGRADRFGSLLDPLRESLGSIN